MAELKTHSLLGGLVAVLVLAGCGGTATTSVDKSNSVTSDGDASSDSVPQEIRSMKQYPEIAACGTSAASGFARCYARVRTNDQGQVTANATGPSTGLVAPDFVSAYAANVNGGGGVTVAIVDANDDPNAEADLNVYRAQFGLPPCTTANGCFKKVNQHGGTDTYPTPDSGWATEISLDLDMVSAVCPKCKILLVEADTASMDDLGASVNEAVALGATVVSNSYGGPEDASIVSADTTYFNHPGVSVFVAAGDSGYGTEYPATSQFVTTVGGTVLARSTSNSRGWVESTWGHGILTKFLGGTGSGCSKYISKPAWQKDASCKNRMETDISAAASNIAIYDSYGQGGWLVVAGTSAATPLASGLYASSGVAGKDASFAWANPSAFFDITSGSNGYLCAHSYYCKATTGYDGPTGFGTPNGAALAALAH